MLQFNNKVYQWNMQMKKLIINADDFGLSKENNLAIKEGFISNIITSTSLITNMEGFNHAVEEVLPEIKGIDVGFHFNIIEGKSLTNPNLLCDKNGVFNKNYLQLILKSNNKKFLEQIEIEFKAQIEKALKHTTISHIDSHVHTHAIPNIFKLITKLAKEYDVPYVRTQREIPYMVWKKSFNFNFAKNIIKNLLLNFFTIINSKQCHRTNEYFIGVLYTGFMDEESILQGLKKIKKNNSITEVIFHPSINENKKNNYREFLITQNRNFLEHLKNSGFSKTTYTKTIVSD